MTDEERVILIRIGVGVCVTILGILLIAWFLCAFGCWVAYTGRILPCAVEVWWKGKP